MMMSEENKAESATDKLRSLLRNIENIADRALGTQPYDEVPCWEHLSSAVGEIEKELALVLAGGNPPAESAEGAENAEPKKKKAIGNLAGVGKVVSYAIDEMYAVTVTARTAGEGEWVFEGIKDGKLVIEGNILGGKWAAAQYCKFLRNGIVSRAKKVWKNHHRRLKEAAIETITPENGGSDGAQPSQGEGAAA